MAELIASLALATDMAMGHPMEQGLGTAIVATRMGELAGLSSTDLSDTCYAALLRHIGCTTERDGLAEMVGDEIGLGAVLDPFSGAKGSEYMAAFVRFVTSESLLPLGTPRGCSVSPAGPCCTNRFFHR